MNLTASRSVLAAKPKEALSAFLGKLSQLGVEDTRSIGRLATETVDCIKGDAEQQQRLSEGVLMRRWYASLTTGSPDYGVYSSPLYLAELWACWLIYSRKYLLSLHVQRNLPPLGIAKLLHPVTRIVDLGCGCGYTSAGFRELFPAAEVVGTNISGSIQYRVACKMASDFKFSMVGTPQEAAGPTTLVFASEYFEHIHEPISHLHNVIQSLRPRFMLIANAFGTKAIGHFHTYKINGELVDGNLVSRLFNAEMKRLGYVKIKTKLWNNRPALWARKAGA
jgi:SAM-dependent methyltransferase